MCVVQHADHATSLPPTGDFHLLATTPKSEIQAMAAYFRNDSSKLRTLAFQGHPEVRIPLLPLSFRRSPHPPRRASADAVYVCVYVCAVQPGHRPKSHRSSVLPRPVHSRDDQGGEGACREERRWKGEVGQGDLEMFTREAILAERRRHLAWTVCIVICSL
jgi:hypothetical protein